MYFFFVLFEICNILYDKTCLIKYYKISLFDDNKQTYLFLYVVSLWPERESLDYKQMIVKGSFFIQSTLS